MGFLIFITFSIQFSTSENSFMHPVPGVDSLGRAPQCLKSQFMETWAPPLCSLPCQLFTPWVESPAPAHHVPLSSCHRQELEGLPPGCWNRTHSSPLLLSLALLFLSLALLFFSLALLNSLKSQFLGSFGRYTTYTKGFFNTEKEIKKVIKSTNYISKFCALKSLMKFKLFLLYWL